MSITSKLITNKFRESPEGSGTGSAETVPVQDIVRSRSSGSLSSSSSNCLAQADSHSRGLEDRTDRESMFSSARFSANDG